jgi:hypothetical protein
LDTSNGLVATAFDFTIENAPLVESVDATTVSLSVNVLSLRRGVEAENVSELTARVNAGDRENLDGISDIATNVFTGDEQTVVAKLDEWAGFNDDRTRQPLPDPGAYPIPPDDTHHPDPQSGSAQRAVDALSRAGLAQSGQGVIADIIRLPGAIYRKFRGGVDSPL